MRKVLVFVFVLIFSSLVSAQQTKAKKDKEQSDSNSNNAALASLTGKSSGFRYQGALWHVPKLRADQEDTTDVLARVDYTINKKSRVRVDQFFTKFYKKYNSEYEFKPVDTNLSYFYRPDYKLFGWNLLTRASAALPISNESNRDDLLTRFTGVLIGTKFFLKNKLLMVVAPYARYHFYEFKTSESGRQLPLYTLGTSLSAIYFITPKFSFSLSGNYNFEGVNKSQYDPNQSLVFDQLNRGIYRFDVDLSYQVTNRLAASLSYFQGASYMQTGRYEMVFYDNENSRYSAGLTYIY